jgi:hypothetical protein
MPGSMSRIQGSAHFAHLVQQRLDRAAGLFHVGLARGHRHGTKEHGYPQPAAHRTWHLTPFLSDSTGEALSLSRPFGK